ncbi:MAG TPA: SgcJ/EcaC family oxidoreductase [Chitinophagaceae bacterium]|nr:SgcJ/EcaC family oxidoreductase [Chitinophagaceae bacterium]
MKKIMFFTIASLFSNLSLSAQGTSHVAERYATLSKEFSYLQTANKDEKAVRTLISTLETGWNNKSGETFASVFADVHDYIVVNGMYFSNFTRQGNAAAHQGLFNGVYKDINVKLTVDKIRFLRPDLALVIALGGRYTNEKSLPENPEIIMTVLAEKKSDSWKIISFHNHNLEADIKKSSPMPLNVMYASWYKK